MARIFDNIRRQLGPPHLDLTFPGHDRIDVALGNFNLRGWNTFAPHGEARAADQAADTQVVRILVGMVAGTDQQQALEGLQQRLEQTDTDGGPTVDHELAQERTPTLVRHLLEQLMRVIPTVKRPAPPCRGTGRGTCSRSRQRDATRETAGAAARSLALALDAGVGARVSDPLTTVSNDRDAWQNGDTA